MSKRAYWETYYHITWHTKDNIPYIYGELETHLRQYLRGRILENRDSVVHEIGGIEDHIHMAVSLPPTIALATWIGEMKGASSHAMNHSTYGRDALHWQIGYGLVTFGQRDLPWVIEYIRNQREHHYKGTIADRLERITHIEVVDGSHPEA